MAIRKEFDWVGMSLSNPDFTNTDFKDNGVNINNTSIASEEVYANNPLIRNDQQFLTNGKFDPHKFHEKYVQLAESYNKLAKDTFDEDIKSLGRVFGENNIFVSPEERRKGATTYMTLIDNPDHINFGITGIDKAGPRTKTPMELAESLAIFDPATGKFTEDTPENSFFKNFWKPMMMATYDTNVDINGNPTDDPNKIAHYAGEHKLNEDGEYYLEFVNGRSTYGKELLSKWNIITKEDSVWNKYDPFDSDDIEKSTTGSIVRNALKIAPLLTPVAPYYAAASIGINLVDALGTLGKLVMGSNNAVLNNITAFAESFNLTVSEEGMQKTFGAENVINMVGDTFMFLRSYRILAEQAPKIFMSETPPLTPEEQKKAVEKIAKNYIAQHEKALRRRLSALPSSVDPAQAMLDMQSELATLLRAALPLASAQVNAQIENFHKIGRQLSTSLMAVTFGLHTYGEAKAQNVSDLAATALTLGAIAGLYLLLSSHISQKIFPEANLQRQLIKKSLQELMQVEEYKGNLKDTTTALMKEGSKEAKVKGTLTLMLKGKDLAEKVWGVNGTIAGTVAANTVATGIEMASFTALDDVIASIYNLGAWISGEKNRMSAWENIPGRYGSALLGGAIAGGMAAPDIYQASQNIKNMQSPQALEIIAHLVNEGKANEVKKVIVNNSWGNPYLSTKKIAEKYLSADEIEEIYGTGTISDNLDLEAKRIMLDTIDGMEKILTEYGARIDSDSLLNVLVNGKNVTHDLRYAMLKESNAAQMYLKEFVKNQVEIYTAAKKLSIKPEDRQALGKTDAEQRALEKENKDLEKLPPELRETADKSPQKTEDDEVRKALRTALKTNAEFLNGKKSALFKDEALFEMLPGINMPFYDGAFKDFVRHETGKEYHEVTLLKKRELAEKFYNTNTGELGLTYMRLAFNLFMQTQEAGKSVLKNLLENSEELKDIESLTEDIRTFVRRELFWGGHSPFDSPYDANSLERPEGKYNINFINNAENRVWLDREVIFDALRKRYKGKDAQIEAAIEHLLNFRNALYEYRRFLEQIRLDVEQSHTAYDAYILRKEKAIKEGKEFNETEPIKLEFNSELIRKRLSAARGIRKAADNYDGKNFEEVISNLIETVEKKRDQEINNAEIAENNGVAYNTEARDNLIGLYRALTEPEAFIDLNYLSEDINGYTVVPDLTHKVESLIEGLMLSTIGIRFTDEMELILSNKSGFLDTETKNILTAVLKVIASNTRKERTISELFTGEVLTKNKVDSISSFNLLTALGIVDKDFENIKTIANRLYDESTDNTSKLSNLYANSLYVSLLIRDYTSSGILKMADALMEKLGYEKNHMTKVLQLLDSQIASQTEQESGILNPTKVNIKEFILSLALVRDINSAILVLQMIRSNIVAADGEVRSAQNAVGFNPTHNKMFNLSGEDALPILTSTQVVENVQYVLDLIYKLMYWKEVAAHAMKMRTELTDQADLGLRLNKFEQVTDIIKGLRDKGWKKIDEFETAIGALLHLNDLKGLTKQERITNQSDEVKESVEKEFISFELALHDFLAANEDIINDPAKLTSLVNIENFKFDEGNDFSAVTMEDKYNDNVSLLWYIASVGALDPRIYYSNLRESYTRRKLPSAILNTWRYQATAFIFNHEYINKFADAVVETYRQQFPDLNSSDVDKKAKAQLDFARRFLVTTINPFRRNIFLVESGPGSGKTNGYLVELAALLHKLDANLDLKNDVWIAGPEDLLGKEKSGDAPGSKKDMPAVKISLEIGANGAKTFTRDTLMKLILKDFDDYERKFKVVNGKISATDDEGNPIVFDVDINTGALLFEYLLNEGLTELPKIIILDEISDYSTFDLNVLQDFAQKHGIKILASGDFTQSGIYGDVQLRLGEEKLDCELRASSCEFIRTDKSAMSYRTTNTQSDNNSSEIITFFEKYIKYAQNRGRVKDDSMPDSLSLSHYFDPATGNLYGTYVANNATEETVRKYIDGIYKSIQNDDSKTVTLLYTDEDSPIYQYIYNHSGDYDWKTKTLFRKGTVLKGVESTYYIIDLDPNVSNSFDRGLSKEQIKEAWQERERVAREIYTALTRQKQGSIVIPRFVDKLPNFDLTGKASEGDTREISMSPEFIEKRIEQLAKLLQSMFPEVIDINKKIGEPSVTPQPEGQPEGEPEGREVPSEGLGTEKNYKVDPDNEYLYEEHKTDLDYAKKLLAEENVKDLPMVFSKSRRKISYISPTEDYTTDARLTFLDENFTGLINTFNTLRTGFAQEGGNLVLKGTDRRDCAHGLYYLMQKGLNIPGIPKFDPNNITTAEEERIKVLLTTLAHIAKTRSNPDILREFKTRLGLRGNNNIYIRWAFISKLDRDGNYKRTPALTSDFEAEKGFGGKGRGKRNNELSRKELCLLVGEETDSSKEILFTLPIGTLTNYRTLIENDATLRNSLIGKELKRLRDLAKQNLRGLTDAEKAKQRGVESNKIDVAMTKVLKDNLTSGNPTPGALTALKLLEIWMATQEFVTYMPGSFLLARVKNRGLLVDIGPFLLTARRGWNYEIPGYEHDLTDPDRNWMYELHDLNRLSEDMDVTRIFTAQSASSHRYQITSGFTIKSGGYYVLVAPKGVFRDTHGNLMEDEMFAAFQRLLNNPKEQHNEVKLLNVRPPKTSVDELMDSEYKQLIESPDRKLRDRQDIGNQFTAYRVLLKMLEIYTPGADDWLNRIVGSTIMVRLGDSVNFDNVRNNVLKLTYLEGQKDSERLAELGKIYEIAERDLSDEDKKLMLDRIANDRDDKDFVGLANDFLREQSEVKYNIRNSFRYLLLYLWDPEKLGHPTINGDVGSKDFIRGVLEDYSLLYNPAYQGAKVAKPGEFHKIFMKYENSSLEELFTFYRTETDNITKNGTQLLYLYKGKNFQYAAEIINGPMYGNVTPILNTILRSFKKGKGSEVAKRVMIYTKMTGKFADGNARDEQADAPLVYYDPGSKADIDRIIAEYKDVYALGDNGYTTFLMKPNARQERVVVSLNTLSMLAGFKVNEVLYRSLQEAEYVGILKGAKSLNENTNIIFTAYGDTDNKHFLISRNTSGYEIREITDPEAKVSPGPEAIIKPGPESPPKRIKLPWGGEYDTVLDDLRGNRRFVGTRNEGGLAILREYFPDIDNGKEIITLHSVLHRDISITITGSENTTPSRRPSLVTPTNNKQITVRLISPILGVELTSLSEADQINTLRTAEEHLRGVQLDIVEILNNKIEELLRILEAKTEHENKSFNMSELRNSDKEQDNNVALFLDKLRINLPVITVQDIVDKLSSGSGMPGTKLELTLRLAGLTIDQLPEELLRAINERLEDDKKITLLTRGEDNNCDNNLPF